jgi:hypothetical protein
MVFPVNYASLTGLPRRIYYQDAAPPAMVPRLTSFINLRILIPPLSVGLTARRSL